MSIRLSIFASLHPPTRQSMKLIKNGGGEFLLLYTYNTYLILSGRKIMIWLGCVFALEYVAVRIICAHGHLLFDSVCVFFLISQKEIPEYRSLFMMKPKSFESSKGLFTSVTQLSRGK